MLLLSIYFDILYCSLVSSAIYNHVLIHSITKITKIDLRIDRTSKIWNTLLARNTSYSANTGSSIHCVTLDSVNTNITRCHERIKRDEITDQIVTFDGIPQQFSFFWASKCFRNKLFWVRSKSKHILQTIRTAVSCSEPIVMLRGKPFKCGVSGNRW